MKLVLFAVIALCFVLAASPTMAQINVETQTAQSQNFSTAIPDLPLPDGVTELADTAVIFDKAEGRIVRVKFLYTLPSADLQSFFMKTLPSLGWDHLGDWSFVRDGEILFMRPKDGDKNGHILDVTLHPHPSLQ